MLKRLWIVALMLFVIGSAAAQDDTPEPTADVTIEPIASATNEATPDATDEATAAATLEVTPEATAEATAESTLPPDTFEGFPGAGSFTVRQEYDSVERTYSVYIPESYREDGDPVALVIILHGAGGTGAGTESFTGFSELAEQENFIVVYPNGINNVWNDGRIGDPRVGNIDDVGFMDGMTGFLAENLNIDPQRVYAAGYSMGGMMAFRLGCELPERFAAVASIASTMPFYLLSTCNDTPPVPVMVIQGTDDPVIPWIGVPNAYLSAALTIGYWGSHNACASAFAVETLPDTAPDDYTVVVRQQLNDCEADVVLYGVYFGGHTWPSHPFSASVPIGQTTHDIDATALLWEFFSSHTNALAE